MRYLLSLITLALAGCIFNPEPKPGKTYIIRCGAPDDIQIDSTGNHDTTICPIDSTEPRPPTRPK